MSGSTATHVEATTQVEVPPALADYATIPALTGPQRQGDLLVVPIDAAADPSIGEPAPLPPVGRAVSRGDATAHTHLLIGGGRWAPCLHVRDRCVVTVTSVAYLLHPEHAALGLAPGRYLIRQQRELGFDHPAPVTVSD